LGLKDKAVKMKRVRCPKCDKYIVFDEKKYSAGQALIFKCDGCGKQFAIKIGVSKLYNKPNDNADDAISDSNEYGFITVIENVFHFKQNIPLTLGQNVIGRYVRGSGINCPIETCDPSMDENHCTITVKRNKLNHIIYTLKDGPSNTGTFVANELLGDHESRIIEDGTLFTIGATSIILHAADSAKQ